MVRLTTGGDNKMANPKIVEAVKKAIEEGKERERKFKESVDLAINLKEVDLSIPKNRIQEEIPLPHGRGKDVKVAVFASGELALKAKDVADRVISPEEISELAEDKRAARKVANEYEFFLADASLMATIGKTLGIALGPRGKMPAPVPPRANIEEIIKRYRSAVRLRVRDQPQVACRIGTEDQSEEELAENAQAIINQILQKYKPYNLDKVYVKLTMGKPVSVKVK